MKKIKWIVAGILVALIFAVVIVYVLIDSLAKAAVEKGGTYALGVPTSLDSARVGLLSGSCALDGLTVANPEGYQTPHLMTVGDVSIDVVPSTLLSDTVQVRTFNVDAVELYVEQKGLKSNVAVILDHLKRLEKEGAPAQEGKRFRIDRIHVTNVQAKLKLLPLPGQEQSFDVAVPSIEIKDLTSDNAKGILLSQIVTKVVPAILLAVVNQAGDLLPSDFTKGIKGGLQGLVGGLDVLKDDLVGPDVKENVDQIGKKIGEGLGGLFKKKDE